MRNIKKHRQKPQSFTNRQGLTLRAEEGYAGWYTAARKDSREECEWRQQGNVNCGGTSGDERPRAEADFSANDAMAGKPGGDNGGVAIDPIAAASAHEIAADAIGPFGGSNWTGLLASCE